MSLRMVLGFKSYLDPRDYLLQHVGPVVSKNVITIVVVTYQSSFVLSVGNDIRLEHV